jgi:hypothetical protein
MSADGPTNLRWQATMAQACEGRKPGSAQATTSKPSHQAHPDTSCST